MNTVIGRPLTAQLRPTAPSWSYPDGNVTPAWCMRSGPSGFWSSSSTPTIRGADGPAAWKERHPRSITGSSATQGVHQAAKNVSTTGRPGTGASDTLGWPVTTADRVNARAVAKGGLSADPCRAVTVAAASTTAAMMTATATFQWPRVDH